MNTTDLTNELDNKFCHLKELLQDMRHVLVAFSGGVDSTLLLKVAADVLGKNVLAVTALSETTPYHERIEAEQFTKAYEIDHMMVQTDELAISEFTQNPENRCYICKKFRFQKLMDIAGQRGIPFVIDGGNRDDHSDYRPGIQAVRELGIRSPLSEAGLTKQDVRTLLKTLVDLPIWNKPAYACLATRIPYHHAITSEKLKQIDQGEEYIRSLGFTRQIRIRHHDDTVRIEIDPNDIARLIEDPLRQQVVSYFKHIGFRFVTLDLEGYVMGSLNRQIQTNL